MGKEANKVDSLSLIVEKQDEEQSENSTHSGEKINPQGDKDLDDSESEIGAHQRQSQKLSTPNPDED